MKSENFSNEVESTDELEAGDTIYRDEIQSWTCLFGADADRFGNMRNELHETPDGKYVHLFFRPGEKTLLEDGRSAREYTVKQVGDLIETTLVGHDDVFDDEGDGYLHQEWPVYEAHWSGTTVSVSTDMDGYDDYDEYDIDALRAAGEHDVTFEVSLVNENDK